MMDEVAKPYAAALSEVLRTADLFEFTAEEGVRVAGELLLSDSFPGEKRNKLALVQRVCEAAATSLLFITHHDDEVPSCVEHVLRLDPGGAS